MAAGRGRPAARLAVRSLAAVLLALSTMAGPTAAAAIPGGPVAVGPRHLSVFVPFPSMQTCQESFLTNCFKFVDGLVVGQVSTLAPLIPLFNLLGVPWGGCAKVETLGTSPYVVEVYAGAGVPLIVGGGGCGTLASRLAEGSAYLAVPGIAKSIPPTEVWVVELDVATR